MAKSHPTMNVQGTITGRFSSDKPNQANKESRPEPKKIFLIAEESANRTYRGLYKSYKGIGDNQGDRDECKMVFLCTLRNHISKEIASIQK